MDNLALFFIIIVFSLPMVAVVVLLLLLPKLRRRNLGENRMQLLQRCYESNACHEIYRDMATGVQYLMVSPQAGGWYNGAISITPLLDRDGKPFVGSTYEHE